MAGYTLLNANLAILFLHIYVLDQLHMKIIFITFFALLFIGCEGKSDNNEPVSALNNGPCKQTEIRFTQAVKGTPLIIPLPEQSDPTLFLMPVSNNKDTLRVDRLYLVDCTQKEFIYERDIYMINEIKKVNDVKDSIVKFIATVTSDKDASQHEYEIDGYTYHQIRKINNGTWDYKSNIKIPVITIK